MITPVNTTYKPETFELLANYNYVFSVSISTGENVGKPEYENFDEDILNDFKIKLQELKNNIS